MEKYKTISKKAQTAILGVSRELLPIKSVIQKQIEGLTKEESNLIALEYIEELHTILCECRVKEGIRLFKENKK
jgi:hypothetical protein